MVRNKTIKGIGIECKIENNRHPLTEKERAQYLKRAKEIFNDPKIDPSYYKWPRNEDDLINVLIFYDFMKGKNLE